MFNGIQSMCTYDMADVLEYLHMSWIFKYSFDVVAY
jgi:hypothetical protein